MLYVDENDILSLKKVNADTWDTLKDDVFIRLINQKYMSKYPEGTAKKNYCDLSIVLSVQEVTRDEKTKQKQLHTHLLTEDELKGYNISFEEALKVAVQNTSDNRKKRVAPFREFTMAGHQLFPILNMPPQMMMQVGSEHGAGFIQDIEYSNDEYDESIDENVLIIFNKNQPFASSYLACPDVLHEVWKRFDRENYYIVPMSIHTLMCIKSSYATKGGKKALIEVEDDLKDMAEDFNDKVSDWKDILTYKIYYYIGDDGNVLLTVN